MDKYLIAHDLGTSGDKASLFSIEGKLVKSYTASYKTHYFHNNYAEQETEDWWEAICRSTKEIVKDIEPEAVLGISFSSQMQACVVVEIPDLTVVIKVCSFDSICVIDSFIFVFIVDWKVCQMSFESPVR